MISNVLSIAGSDPSGGAGIQADLKTISTHGCYGMAAITALTAQNTQGVFGVHEVPHDFVAQQINVLFDDIRIDAIKIGMAGSVATIATIAEEIQRHKPKIIVLDPVMVAQSGDALLSQLAIDALRRDLMPLASIITPNIPEAEMLLRKKFSDFDYDMSAMAKALLKLGARGVLLKGGHLSGPKSMDVFVCADGTSESFEAPRLQTKNTHGTGCTLSSALACWLARGLPQAEACRAAKKYITASLQAGAALNIGKGAGPVHHFHAFWH
jgi:hydroxymethylpyrimidine/phosphomethylpyrimidine kinase